MPEFTEFEEEQIILLALDSPEFFFRIVKFMDHEYFENDAHQYIMASYLEYYQEYDDTPTREVLKNRIFRELKLDNEIAEPVMSILDKELDVRNSRYIRDTVIKWAKVKQLSLLYSEEVMDNIKNGDSHLVEDIIDKAMSITDVVIRPFRFFDDVDGLFVDDERDYFTTGFSRLDQLIHDGNGPAKREVFIWIAPTGVGKCHTLESKIILENISTIYDLELEDGTHKKLAGFREVKTRRGKVRVCDLTEEDYIEELPNINDEGDVCL